MNANLTREIPPIPANVTLTLTADDAVLVAIAIDRVLATRHRPPGDVTDVVGQRLASHRDYLRSAPASVGGSETEVVWQRRPGPPLTPAAVASALSVTTRTVTTRCAEAHRAGVAGIHKVGRSWSIERDAIEALR